MTTRVVVGARWAGLMDHLASALAAASDDPFQTLRVVTSSRATGRVVGQEIAARLGISAGINYLSPSDLMRELAAEAGVATERSRWHGTALELAVSDALSQSQHPLVKRALSDDDTRPGRRRATALRVAQLLRGYLDQSPELVAAWLNGSDLGPGDTPLPHELSWQPAVLRGVVAALELDPVAMMDAICAAARADSTPTFVVAVDHLTQPQERALCALAQGAGITVVLPAEGGEWVAALEAEPMVLDDAPPAPPVVAVHNSHAEARQVEVLRDELTRLFAEDPSLEPRDVVVVCAAPERYSGLLDAVFSPADDGAHPGRTLRLQPPEPTAANPVLELLVRLLRLGSTRATATELVEIVLHPAVAHRWRLNDRRALTELVAGAGIRWGLDEQHRAAFNLAGVEQNTWLRGLDRLLIGLAASPEHDVGLGLTGTESVTSSDLSLVGALCELAHRIRTIVASAAGPATVQEWVQRSREALALVVGVPFADEWQHQHALGVLAQFEADHHGRTTQLTPHEFAHFVELAAAPSRARVAAGNGALQVIPLGELQHVEFRVVALLGITDDIVPGRAGGLPDSVDLGALAPDLPARRLRQLLHHGRSAQQLLIVQQTRSQRTNDPTARPVAVSWLLGRLGVEHTEVDHPPTAADTSNFAGRGSFDTAAHAGALQRSKTHDRGPSMAQRRRRQAHGRAVGPSPHQVTLKQLALFLKDPAKAFLRSAGGIALYDEPAIADEMPLEVHGLDNWRLVNALVDSWKAGTPIESVERRFRQREDLPPAAIGARAFAAARKEATILWQSAWADWSGAGGTHVIDLTLSLEGGARVRLLDEVRTRGGFALAASPSQSTTGILQPWLESLALAAQGVEAPAKLHYFIKNASTSYAVAATDWTAPTLSREQALAHLCTLASAYSQGQHRLLPVPVAPALTYAREQASGRFKRSEWTGALDGFGGKWSKPNPAWRLFFDDDVSDLLLDPPLPGDPTNAQESAFQAWAVELYAPLMRGGR